MARLVILFAIVSAVALGQSNPGCVVTLNGKAYDFNQFAKNSDYSFPDDAGKGYTFFTNLCQQIISSPCPPGTSMCQTWAGSGLAALGVFSTMVVTAAESGGTNGYGAKFSFNGGTQGREYEMDMKCDPTVMNQGSPAFMGENPPLHYNFEWRSIFACPLDFIKKEEEGQKKSPLGGGSIILIIVLVLVVVYLVGGVLFNKFYKKENGIELIPNRGLWFAIPGLVKDGFMFLVNKVFRRGNNAYSKL